MGSSLVSSAAARSSPRDLQPTTALSLLYRRTIPPGWGRAGRSGGLGVVRRVGGGGGRGRFASAIGRNIRTDTPESKKSVTTLPMSSAETAAPS